MLAKNLKKDDIIMVIGTKYMVTGNFNGRVSIAMEDKECDGGWRGPSTYDYSTIDDCKFTMVEIDWKARLEVAQNGF